jgi:hypothetical protein
MRARLYLEHITRGNEAPLVSRSGDHAKACSPRSHPAWALTVIRDSSMNFFIDGQGHATYHGCALPTELSRHN